MPGRKGLRKHWCKSDLHAKAAPSLPDNPRLVQTNQYFMKTVSGSVGGGWGLELALQREGGPQAAVPERAGLL